eukprot:CAMPEP_0204599356 /NCGR_PEP_ID=MMETSP0661-20131031/54776_1 /ASSEMBLY_ACC=CAM_ASM_000606 /TAXON_ID=109239 /ORGANISM="Alexandrium margalefi, Strain AMGDE01CS-322" /LENGTH=506 /DNA_ID=CAMNT_0051610073 /DNA_START=60 /DNA_END=1580 /DNA_ORIENTATION=+
MASPTTRRPLSLPLLPTIGLAAWHWVPAAGTVADLVDDSLAFVQAGFWPSPARFLAAGAGSGGEGVATSWQRRQALKNFQDMQYFAEITVGGQVVTGIIDTGSFELVVFEKHCSGCGVAAKFDHDRSGTYRPGPLSRSLAYGSGDLYAREAFDSVSVGSFSAVNQSFWEAFEGYMPILDTARFQSIIGVGPPEMPAYEAWSNTAKSIRVVERRLSQRRPHEHSLKTVVDNVKFSTEVSLLSTVMPTYGFRAFSLCLGSRPMSSGYFVWNDTSAEDRPASFKRVPVVGRHTWTVKMTSVRLAPRGLLSPDLEEGAEGTIDLSCAEGCGAVVDSGTSFLMVPSVVASSLQEELTRLEVNCSNMHEFPDLVFTLGDQTFSLPPDAYVTKVKRSVHPSAASLVRVRDLSFESGECELSVIESTSTTPWGPLWILGMPFFRKYYTTFDLGRTRAERALLIAQAGTGCYPSSVETSLALDSRRRVFSRSLDLAGAYVSPLVREALSSDQLEL